MSRLVMSRLSEKVAGKATGRRAGTVLMTVSLVCCTNQNAVAVPVTPLVTPPVTSPSVQMAAGLAHHPPRGWIRHYLPADRYKIKGGIWKYVSTETDTHYHRPDSPLMLCQSPDIVIGFASTADAEEGGYQPGPSVTLQDRGGKNKRALNNRNLAPFTTLASRRPSIAGGAAAVAIPAAAIPKHILDFIRLVDGLAAEIEAASTPSQLNRIRRQINLLSRGNTAQSGMAHLSGDREDGNTQGSMAAVIQVLERAVDAKLRPNPAGIPLDRQLLNAARSGARALIPQVQVQFRQQAEQNRRNMLRRPAGRPLR